MNVVLIVPTGIGCEIGGHAGDANPVAKLIGKCCDKLITHPNVVNASDINEMPENTLYVEGSMLNRFLRSEIFLKEVHYNKILLAVNKPVDSNTINSVNAAISTIGADIEIVELNTELKMLGYFDEGLASGDIKGMDELISQISNYKFDALAVQSFINVDLTDSETTINYFKKGGVNPWGGVEAYLSKYVSKIINKPVAHSPFYDIEFTKANLEKYNFVVDKRMAAEMVSVSYLHCILKGLHKAPRITQTYAKDVLARNSVDFLITPINCVGEPHFACMKAGIPIIAVRENKSVLNDKMPDSFIVVDNYIEAAGLLMAYKSGINWKSVRRL